VFNALCQHFLKSSSLRPRARALSFSLENCQKARALEPRAPDSIHHSPVKSLGIKSWTGNLTSQFGITPRDGRISRRLKDLEKTCGLSLSLSLSKTGPRRGRPRNLPQIEMWPLPLPLQDGAKTGPKNQPQIEMWPLPLPLQDGAKTGPRNQPQIEMWPLPLPLQDGAKTGPRSKSRMEDFLKTGVTGLSVEEDPGGRPRRRTQEDPAPGEPSGRGRGTRMKSRRADFLKRGGVSGLSVEEDPGGPRRRTQEDPAPGEPSGKGRRTQESKRQENM
jgi:hypothetical protein